MDRHSSFFRPGGTLEPGAQSYIVRKADEELLSALIAREYVFLLDSRQKGKSSLVARTIIRLRAEGVCTVKLDLQRIGANVTPEQWYAGLVVGIGQELGLLQEMLAYWKDTQAIGPLARFVGAIQEVVLTRIVEPLVIFIDEIDFVRALDFSTDEFFAGIRECYNRRSSDESFKRLTFCLVGVATPGQLIRNADITPFNIGTKIELTDFTLEESKCYVQVLEPNGEKLIGRVHHWVNGHPYLTQLLCSHIAECPAIGSPHDVDRLVKELFFTPEARHSEPNFAAVEQRILDPDVPGMSPDERKIQVLELYGRLLRGKGVAASEENPVVASLQLAGVGHQLRGSLCVRNLVYRTVFDEDWRRQSLPNAELRRQRGAARLAILRTAAVAGVVVLAISSTAFDIFRISKERERALFALGQRTKDLSRVSSDRKVALADLERRNDELKRISKEREVALSSLGKSNRELSKTSDARKRAVVALEKQSSALSQRNEELSRVSKERKQALVTLGARTNELAAKNYVGLMSSIQLAERDKRYSRIAELVNQSEDSPCRGWEWGHAALNVRRHLFEGKVPQWSWLDREADGRLLAISSTADYGILKDRVQLLRHFPIRGNLKALRGDLRLEQIESPWKSVVRDTKTNRVIAESMWIWDVDPVRRRMIVSGEEGPELRSIEDNRLLATYKGETMVWEIRFLPSGDFMTVHDDGAIRRCKWDGTVVASATTALRPIKALAEVELSQDGKLFVAWDGKPCIPQIRDSGDLHVVATLSGPPINVTCGAFSPDGRIVAIGCDDAIVRLFEVQTGRLIEELVGHLSEIRRVTFDQLEDHLVSLAQSGEIRVWSTYSAPLVDVYAVQTGQVRGVSLSPDGSTINCITMTGEMASQDRTTGRIVKRSDPGRNLYWTARPLGSHIFWGTRGGTLEKLEIKTLAVEGSTRVFADSIEQICWTTDKTLLLESAKREFAVVEAENLKVIGKFRLGWKISSPSMPSVSLDREGALAVMMARSEDPRRASGGEIQIISLPKGQLVRRIKFSKNVLAAVIAPNGKTIAATIAEGLTGCRVVLLEVATGHESVELSREDTWVQSLQWNRHGEYLVGISEDAKGHIWSMKTRSKLDVLSPGAKIYSIQFSPDGKRFITSATNRSTIIWDAESATELYALQYTPLVPNDRIGPSRGDYSHFSKDGRDIIMSCTDGSVRIWHSLPWRDQPKALRK